STQKKAELGEGYKEDLQRECCLDGMKDSPVSYTCERRSEYILDGQACVDAFVTCCKEMEKQQLEKREESLTLARSKILHQQH
uniref:Anaphylatoxin-like domain-containing protein n=1 Tax=Oryzias latipes TaxID=8090 RepID=A0A3B3H564_ORYLA